MPNRGRAYLLALVCLLVTSGAVFLQNLGTPHITLWDEAIHVNVIKNLAEHCCSPQLHRSVHAAPSGIIRTVPEFVSLPHSNVGIDYRDWTNNTAWLHKPLLPFYLTAGVYRALGGSLWALRLPGAIFALLTTSVIYLIGHRFLGDLVGLCGAAIFAFNPFTNQLVHGITYSGFPDLMFVFFLSLALYLILSWTRRKSAATLRWLGFVLGLGYLCKGGLALAPFVVLAGIMIFTGGIRQLIPALQSVFVFAVTVLPERLFWLAHYPAEFRYEQQQQFHHLFKVIEGHGGSWQSYVIGFFSTILLMPLVSLAYFSIGWGLTRCRPDEPGWILSAWTLAYIVPLSFAASKIENFIFPVLPAVALLVPHALDCLMRAGRFRLVLSLCTSVPAAWIFFQVTQNHGHQFLLTLLGTIAVVAATFGLLFLINFESKLETTWAVITAIAALLSLYVHDDLSSNFSKPADGTPQAVLRQSASELQPLVDRSALILAHVSSSAIKSDKDTAEYAYLYLMYWSGVDFVDICLEPLQSKAVASLREQKNLYLITDDSLSRNPLARLPIGNLYSLGEVPFEVWSKAALAACQSR